MTTTTKKPKYVYVLRVNDAENKSCRKTFQYPKRGTVTAPDWSPDPVCGGGLHGWENGEGDSSVAEWYDDGVWLVLKVLESDLVRLGGKVKFKTGTIAHAGTKESATRYIWEKTKAPRIIGLVLTGGDYSTLTGGDRSTLTGGYYSTLTGGDGSTLTGGYGSTLTGGHRSTLTGGYGSTLTGGHRSTLTGGHRSTLTGGDYSTLTGGDGSTLTGGYGSTLTGGDYSTLTGGDRSTLTGGDRSTLCWRVWDGNANRLHVRYTGEDGIEPNKAYRFVNGEVVAV
jgi:hypothetical protein